MEGIFKQLVLSSQILLLLPGAAMCLTRHSGYDHPHISFCCLRTLVPVVACNEVKLCFFNPECSQVLYKF